MEAAQQWRQRLGLERNLEWDKVKNRLSKPAIREGIYTAIEVEPFTIYRDHPSMVAALGVLPQTPLIERKIMDRTFEDVMAKWNWPTTWGWDYPMLAMTAARLGKPERAIEALFIETPKNRYGKNGHNYQRENLPLYLPGNGGLLTAAAMMAAGWDDGPNQPEPGFPQDGSWTVHWEGLRRMP